MIPCGGWRTFWLALLQVMVSYIFVTQILIVLDNHNLTLNEYLNGDTYEEISPNCLLIMKGLKSKMGTNFGRKIVYGIESTDITFLSCFKLAKPNYVLYIYMSIQQIKMLTIKILVIHGIPRGHLRIVGCEKWRIAKNRHFRNIALNFHRLTIYSLLSLP